MDDEKPPWWLRAATTIGSGMLGAAGVVGGFLGVTFLFGAGLAVLFLLGAEVSPRWLTEAWAVAAIAATAGGYVGANRLRKRLHARQQALLDEIPERPRLTAAVGGSIAPVAIESAGSDDRR